MSRITLEQKLEAAQRSVEIHKARLRVLEARVHNDEVKEKRRVFSDINEDFSFYAENGYWINKKGEYVEICKMDDKYIMRCLNKLISHKNQDSPQAKSLSDVYIPIFIEELNKRGYITENIID